MARTIWVSRGAAEYVGGTVTETEGADITLATLEVAFSETTRDAPEEDAYIPPDVDEAGSSSAARTVKLLLDQSAATFHGLSDTGTYYLWVRVVDTPEIAPRPFSEAILPR